MFEPDKKEVGYFLRELDFGSSRMAFGLRSLFVSLRAHSRDEEVWSI
jgi:hypothetical protein